MIDQFEKAKNKGHLPVLGSTPSDVETSLGRWQLYWLKPAALAVAAFIMMYLWRFSPFEDGYTAHFAHNIWCFFAGSAVVAVLILYLQINSPYVKYVRDLHGVCDDYNQVNAVMNEVAESENKTLIRMMKSIAEHRASLYWYEVEWFKKILATQVLSTLKEKR
jgi:hypothetical protein